MTVLILSALLTVTVIASGLTGGVLVRKAAPTLMLKPRLAVVALLTTAAIWIIGFAALGPMFAWGLSGPTHLIPGNAGIVCQRCLDAANPLPPGLEVDTFLPLIVLLAVPLLLGLTMVVNSYRYLRRSATNRRRLEQSLGHGAYSTRLAGHAVTVIEHHHPTAFSVANRRQGIVVSTALFELLTEDELTAVMTHEAAHLRQRHHLILSMLHGAIAPLRWVPLLAAIDAAIPHYLEMAADNAARYRTSTPVMASALLKLGEKAGPGVTHDPCGAVALHAAGVDRIRHLIAPPDGKDGITSVSAMVTVTGLLLAGSLVVHLPYLRAVLDGCLM